MANFGDNIRLERKRRGISLAEIADATKISRRYLQALEAGSFGELPGGIFNKGYVRAYAQVVGLDEEATVQAYEAAEHERVASAAPAGPLAAIENEPAEAPARPRRRLGALLAVAVVVVAGAAAGAWSWLGEGAEPAPELAAATAVRAVPPEATPPPDPPVRPEPAPTEVAPPAAAPIPGAAAPPARTEPEAAATTDPGSRSATAESPQPTPPPARAPAPRPEPVTAASGPDLSVPDHGVGTGVVAHELEGRTDRFEPGERVWFWTRVVGGASGDRIRHVWIHDGRPVETIELRVGGPRWRTHSVKTLYDAGTWSVEARDADGHVLARDTFVCSGS